MQPLDRSVTSPHSASDFEVPVLPYESNIDHLLASSRHLQRIEREASSNTMSSVADDSSVAESVSSVGADGWEAIDRFTAEEDSDYNDEAARLAPPLHDVLTESALLTPPESVQDAVQEKDTLSASAVEDEEAPEDEQGCDVSLLWDSKQITFPEKSDGIEAERQQDVTCSVAAIGGKTAQSFVEGSTWSDLENIAGSLRMKLAPQRLIFERPLRLFYVGSDEFEDEIEAKIGSALVAGYGDNVPRRRRRSIMPISLSKESPEVQLNPDVGANMEIETCTGVQHAHDAHETMKVLMDNGIVYTSSWDREQQCYFIEQPETSPDLAVIHIPEDEDEHRTLRLRARQFLSRHSIPTILITSNRQWQAPARPLTIDIRSPHFIVHVPGTSISESAVLRRLPVDIDTFLQLNSLQLNRSLAAMIDDGPSQTRKLSKQSSGFFADNAKYFSFAMPIVYLLVGLFMMNLASMSPSVSVEIPNVSVSSTTTIQTSSAATMPSASVSTNISKSLTIPQLKDVAQVPDHALRPNTSEKFQAEILGSSIVILKPPRWYTIQRRAPKLDFKVSRNGVPLEHEVSQLSDAKIFAISIPWEMAYGPVEVHILSSNTRGIKVNETTRVDFGSSMWKMLNWQNSAKDEPKDKPTESEQKPPIEFSHAKERLVQDIEVLRKELLNVGTSLRTKVVDSLVSFNDARQKIFRERRQSREDLLRDVGSRIVRGMESVQDFRRTHFREQQKDLLKLWWKIKGVPADFVATSPRDKSHGKKTRKVTR